VTHKHMRHCENNTTQVASNNSTKVISEICEARDVRNSEHDRPRSFDNSNMFYSGQMVGLDTERVREISKSELSPPPSARFG
jgi:hypothetical protein